MSLVRERKDGGERVMMMVISSEKGFLDPFDSGEGRGGDKGLW